MPQNALTQEEWDALGETKVLEPVDVPTPVSKAPYDFEATESHGFPSEHNMLPEADVVSETEGPPTQVFQTENVKPLKEAAKQQAKRRMTDAEAQANMRKAYGKVENPDLAGAPDTETELAQMAEKPPASISSATPKAEMAPSKSIEQLAQEDAERILGKKPIAPPKVGTMEGKPVVPETIKVPDAALGPVESPPGIPGKVMTPGGVVEGTAAPAKPAGLVKMTAEDIGQTVRSNAANSIPKMAEGDLGGYSVSLAEKAAAAEARSAARRAGLRSFGKGALGFAKDAVRPLVAPFTEPAAALGGWSEAGAIGKTGKLVKAGFGLGKGLAKAGGELVLGALDQGVLEADYNKLTYGTQSDIGDPNRSKGIIGAQAQYFANKQEYNRVANKYGMRVTGSDPSVMQMLNPFFNQDPNLQVHEDPALKAAFMKKQHERIAAIKQEQEEQQAQSPNATPSYVNPTNQ